jgi:hypothetical protein
VLTSRLGRILATVTVVALGTACGSDASKSSSDSTQSSTPTKSISEPAPASNGSTAFGTTLKLGKPAVVRQMAKPHGPSRLRVTVSSVRKGRIADLEPFQLDRRATRSNVFYAKLRVRNIGHHNVDGHSLPLFAKVSATQVVPPVAFGSTFRRCSPQTLPKSFKKGKGAKLCLVFLAPHHGHVTEIQWRTSSSNKAISWKLH